MDELDLKLQKLKSATENLSPPPSVVARLHQAVHPAGRVGSTATWMMTIVVACLAAGALLALSSHRTTPSTSESVSTGAPKPAVAVAPTSSTPPTPVALPPVQDVRADGTPKHPAPACRAWVVADSTPTAAVLVDGKPTGRWTPISPNAPLSVEAEEHLITYKTTDGKVSTLFTRIECGTNVLPDVAFETSAPAGRLAEPGPPPIAPPDGREEVGAGETNPEERQGEVDGQRRLREASVTDRAPEPAGRSGETRDEPQARPAPSERPASARPEPTAEPARVGPARGPAPVSGKSAPAAPDRGSTRH